MTLKNIGSLCFLLTVITFGLINRSLALPTLLEDGILLRQIADSYSAPLVASFLQLRIQNTAQMFDDVKNSLTNLNTNQRNLFTLKVKSLKALDEQLTSLQKTAYFIMNGTERVKYLIEQYILTNEIFPTELGSEEGKFNSTPDYLLKQINIASNGQLIKDTNDLLNMHIKDIEEKELNVKYNQLQRLAASITKNKLTQLVNFKYSEPITKHDRYGNPYETVDNRASQIKSVLQQFKNILDLFYPQFANLADLNSNSPSLSPGDKASIHEKKETESDVIFKPEFTTSSS